MRPQPETIRPISELDYFDNQQPLSGAEKSVYKMTDGHTVVAAKVFHEANSATKVPINREDQAVREFHAYLRLRSSVLCKYTPEPFYLLSSGEEIIGLAVAWRNPQVLSDLVAFRVGRRTEIDILERSLIKAAKNGIIISPDMISEFNIGFDPDFRPRIFFAECQLMEPEVVGGRLTDYLTIYRQGMMYLKERYT